MRDVFPDDVNGDALRNMQMNGDDLRIARDIDFSVMFEDEDLAREFCHVLRQYRSSLERYCDEQGELVWDVTITSYMTPTYEEISAMELYLQKMSAPLGGYIDGWGCFSQTGH